MKNKIYIKGIEVFSYHGVFPEENILGQKFLFDIKCNLNFKEAMISDNLEDSVSYGEITELVYEIAKNNKYNLLERLAFEIIKNIFEKYTNIEKITLKINKPNAPISKNFRECGIEIEVAKEEYLEIMKGDYDSSRNWK